MEHRGRGSASSDVLARITQRDSDHRRCIHCNSCPGALRRLAMEEVRRLPCSSPPRVHRGRASIRLSIAPLATLPQLYRHGECDCGLVGRIHVDHCVLLNVETFQVKHDCL